MSKFIKVFALPVTGPIWIGRNLSDYRKTRHLDSASKEKFDELLAARDKLRGERRLMGGLTSK